MSAGAEGYMDKGNKIPAQGTEKIVSGDRLPATGKPKNSSPYKL